MGYEPIKESKKLFEKLKLVCTTMSKYNLNSPCLLQFVRHNGTYDVVLSHNPSNGDRYDYYKIFNSITHDNFSIAPEDEDCFKTGDERVSVPIIVSSCELTERNEITQIYPRKYWDTLMYDYSIDTYYIFPKYVLKALKEDVIKGFEAAPITFIGPVYQFSMNILYDDKSRFGNTLFIHNNSKLDNIYNLNVFPYERPNSIKDILTKIYLNQTEDYSGFLTINCDEWDKLIKDNQFNSAMNIKSYDNNEFLIYHNDFFQKKIKSIFLSKFYESNRGSIVSMYVNTVDNRGVNTYFKYKYFEL